jgi:hypothetical protein
MTGPEHWAEADLILTGNADPCSYGCPHTGCPHEMAMIARAQVHATLAVAAVTALGGVTLALPPDNHLAREWNRVTGVAEYPEPQP